MIDMINIYVFNKTIVNNMIYNITDKVPNMIPVQFYLNHALTV